ncbi:MAG: UbiH/UbiF/VisC/COQ6 family ubiquinone biosynthesis hydroxylase [Alphaproteobacteria bacterium]|nr:UbiH/UbiF/VisC/COQ6 family ubiquinone biosynthesis hydroxylase [Alphaproteobacteria bacterium]NCQ67394.1 UbiH/UbiF/VisC/COQ6 family ubiquinone biosynthesis hydroxylase [Alphaproteobacteria bacterium]NCT06640.1 UbiH/UbiF/VisC/COQ6 family ubiquinone biosynthesis hydroxylase [Alphaproteobacteria bacterium]
MSEQNKTESQNHFDILIIGGGPVGMTAALLMCQQGFKAALFDRLDYKDVLSANYDGRTFAYAYGSKLVLEKAGIWKDLESHAQEIQDIFVTSEGPGEGLHYAAAEIADHPMGFNIETRHFRATVYEALQKQENFHLFAPCDIDEITFHQSHVKVQISGKDSPFTAPLALAADGKNSFIREQVGLKSKTIPYNQKALVFVIDHEKSHNNCAYEHFLKTGPVALLPMKDEFCRRTRCGVIWSLHSDRADDYYALSNSDLETELSRHFSEILGPLSVNGRRWLFPLDVTVVKNYVAPRLVLIGDSAHAIHPVAGQGFNLGLRDVSTLATHLNKAKDLGLDLGSLTLLKDYEKKRRKDILSMTAMCDGLVRLFSNDNKSLGHLRRMGLDLTDKLPMLKKTLTRHAMGL